MSKSTYERKTLKEQWARSMACTLDPRDGVPAVLAKYSALSDWERLRSAPAGRAEDELRNALLIATASYNHPLVRACLERTLKVAEAGSSDQRWNTTWASTRKIHHGLFSSASTLARAWFLDTAPEAARILSASNEILDGSVEDWPAWTELAQSDYIHGLQLLLMAGDIETAMSKCWHRTKFSRVQRYYDWHVTLIKLLREQSESVQELSHHFDPYFDELRDPYFQAPSNDSHGNNLLGIALVRLRLALIRWIYIERKPIAGNWRHIIGQIGY